jgi:hypothetical protein
VAGSCLSLGIGPVFWSTIAFDPLPPVASVCFREAHFRLLPYAAGARAS